MKNTVEYRGRFAPTPSGPLHLGSLLTALASWLEARHRGGRWLLRIDDLDRPRCPPGMEREIMRQLRAHALEWDGEVRYQTAQAAEYGSALERLQGAGLVYACQCTRAELSRHSLHGPDGAVYAGLCRELRLDPAHGRRSLRMRVPARVICLDDGTQPRECRTLASEVGDFVVRRSDRQFAYQLACAVDEHALGITEVVRGSDLLGSTFQQLCVLQALGHAPPRYRHLPLLVGPRGQKLSKQNRALPLQDAEAPASLRRCLGWLGQPAPPPEAATPARILGWAAERWRSQDVPRVEKIRVD